MFREHMREICRGMK